MLVSENNHSQPNATETNDPGTTSKVYGPDGNVQKEYNKGHGINWPIKSERDDNVHDHKPNANNPGATERLPGRKPKPNELDKDKAKQEKRRNNPN